METQTSIGNGVWVLLSKEEVKVLRRISKLLGINFASTACRPGEAREFIARYGECRTREECMEVLRAGWLAAAKANQG